MEAVPLHLDVPVVHRCDVLVVGGGPAGIAAAIAAARTGARTTIVERYGFLGGNATASLVGPFMSSFSDDGEEQLVIGIFDEIVRRMEAMGGAIHPERVRAGSAEAGFYLHGHDHVTPFDPEALKTVAAEMIREAGGTLLLHSFFVQPIMDGDRVDGIIVANKSGLQALRAEVVIDCSADADVAARAGVPFTVGRERDGLMQPMTMFFRVANVNDAAVEEYVLAHPEERGILFKSLVEEAKARGEFPIAREKVGIYRTPQKGVWRVNTSRIQGVDGTDVRDLTRAEIEGRKQVHLLMRFFRDRLPGFADATLLDTATQIGVRETRHMRGRYTLTAEDLATGRHFPDVIARYAYPMDIHSPTEAGGYFSESGKTANSYEIPFGSLVPVGVSNMLIAGRCLSATHEAHAAVRVMPAAFAMGQAAGTAAALGVEHHVPPGDVPIPLLQRTLLAAGANLGPAVAETVGAGR
jgi:FAD-dependent oxidoreductase family protein